MDFNVIVKPACAAASIYVIDKFMVKNPNTTQTMYIAGGVGAGFFLAKAIAPYIPHFDMGLGSLGVFNSQAIESRIIETAVAGGTIYALAQAKLLTLPTTKSDIMTLGVTILVADMLGEELLPFFGYVPAHQTL